MREQVSANKNPQGKKEALTLSRAVSRVVVARGKKTVTFDMKKDPPDQKTLLAAILGPTGKLRAPTIRRGSTLLVGFNEAIYTDLLG